MKKITLREFNKKPLYELQKLATQHVQVSSSAFVLLAKTPKDKDERLAVVRKYGHSRQMIYYADGHFARVGGPGVTGAGIGNQCG